MYKLFQKPASVLLVFTLMFLSFFTTPVKALAIPVQVSYQAYVQTIGWQSPVTDGTIAGTTDRNLRMEAIKISLKNAPVKSSIKYSVYIQNIGWRGYVTNGKKAGITGRNIGITAIRIALVNMPGYIVEYQIYTQNSGWQAWAKNDQIAGIAANSPSIEAIKIKVTKVVTSVVVSPATVVAGHTVQMNAVVNPLDATDNTLLWSVSTGFGSGEQIATINATTGLLTAIKDGAVTVTATATNGIFGTSTVTISPEPIQLTITDPLLTLSKAYDGTKTASVEVGTLIGVLAGDFVFVSAIASYDNSYVGIGKTITVVYSLSGANAAKYSAPVNYVVTNGEITGTIQNYSQVISMIDALPKKISGIPLLSANVDEINSITNVSSVIKDTSSNYDGIYPIKITSATGGTTSSKFGKVFSTVKNLSNLTNIELLLWFYENNPELSLNDLRIDLVTDADNYFYLYVNTYNWLASPGACRVRYNFSRFSKVGSPDITRISKINFRMSGNSGKIESIGIFSISYNARSSTKVILAFDDGWQDTYTNAFPILNAEGFKGVTYAVSDFVQDTDPNYMRKSALDILYNAGWDIGNHSQRHEAYKSTSLIDATYMTNSIKNCLDYLLSCGYDRSARFLCYPDGDFDDELISKIKEIGIIAARTTITGFITEPPTDLYKLKTDYIGHDTTFGGTSSNDIKSSIDKAIATGETLAIMMHRVSPDSEMNTSGDNTNSIKTSISMLTKVVQYLKATGVEVCTMSQWYDKLASTPILTLLDKDQVVQARAAYDNLDASQKALVSNYNVLTDAENKIASMENAVNEIIGYASTQNASLLKVSQLIEAGIVRIFESRLSGYKTVIASASPSSVDTTAKIQALIDSVTS